MNRKLSLAASLSVACALAACSGSSPSSLREAVATTSSALSDAGNIPLPIARDSSSNVIIDPTTGGPLVAWDGSVVDLMAADAWAQCAAGLPSNFDQSNNSDPYLKWLQGRMDSWSCPTTVPDGGVLNGFKLGIPSNVAGPSGWAERRLNPQCNIVGSGANAAVPLTNPTMITLPTYAGSTVYTSSTVTLAQTEVNFAQVNLCMAQRLREHSSSGDALTLSALDQRELLEITRERAQIAMLQYALLGVIFASATPPGTYVPTTFIKLGQVDYVMQQWARDASATPTGQAGVAMASLGQDFAAATQLHSIVTGELANLLWRSASARLPRDPTPQSTADDAWGPGSWRQRTLALLYGGDPLVTYTPPGATPSLWDHYAGKSTPVASDVSVNPKFPLDWPGKHADEPGFASADASAPQIATLLGLARTYDALYLKATPAPATVQAGASIPAYEDIDRPTSATQLYSTVEGNLEADACSVCVACSCACPTGNTACLSACGAATNAAAAAACSIAFAQAGSCANPANPGAAPAPAACGIATLQSALASQSLSSTYQATLLWQQHQIGFAHATALVSQFADAVPRAIGNSTTRTASLPGAQRLLGTGNAYVTNAQGDWYHVDPKATLTDLGLTERAPLFSRLTSFSMIPAANPLVDGYPLGVLPIRGNTIYGDDSPRTMGAAAALAAVREALETAIGTGTTTYSYGAPKTGYFALADQILGVIDGATGGMAVSTHPSQQVVWISSPCLYPELSCPMYEQQPYGSTLMWEVGLSMLSDHPFASTSASYNLVAIPGGMLATMLAANPGSKSFLPDATNLNTIGGLVQASFKALTTTSTPLASVAVARTSGASTTYRRWQVSLPGNPVVAGGSSVDPRWSLVLMKTDSSTGAVSYLPLGESIYLHSRTASWTSGQNISPYPVPAEGQYLPYGGSFGEMARQAWQGTPGNWSRPRYDGYGLSTSWVPPTDPALLGGQAGETASAYYLGAAGAAADQATDAVKSAMDALIMEEQDDAALAAAQQKAAGITQQQEEAFCGGSNTSCDSSTTAVTPRMPAQTDIDAIQCSPIPQVNYDGITIDADYTQSCQGIKQAMVTIFAAASTTFAVGTAVANAKDQDAPPSFSDYSGGTLQNVYITQWGALRHLEDLGHEVFAAGKDAWAQVDVAYRQKAFADYQAAKACSTWSIVKGILSCFSLSGGGGGDGSGGGGIGISFNPSAFFAMTDKCAELRAQDATTGDSQIVAAEQAGLSRLASLLTEFVDAAVALQQASAQGAKAAQDARLAIAQANLEASLAAGTQVTKFGAYRRYHSYDMWRAQALLESTRRYALSARRAVEAEYVIDLSTMEADEPYVAAPATWADDVYQYDLDAPAAVGLSVTPSQAGGLYPNQLSDYIGNLNRVVQGYPVARPTAIAKNDSSIVTLTGPDGRVTETVNGQAVSLLPGDAARWQFFCPNTNTWVSHPAADQRPATTPLAQACDPNGVILPTLARLPFSLDPWGRIDGDIANPPVSQQYNARWVQLAVNLVGTGVKDCTRAADPQSCYTEPFVALDLTHSGPALVTDYNQQWHSLDVGSGIIEGAKALAAEEWLDPITDGWSQPDVAAVARTELVERPLGGGYVLVLHLAPEVRPEHIESVQILLQDSYWVKQ